MSACLLLAGGCAKSESPIKITYTEAQKLFEAKCREEFDLHVITRLVGGTLYIYFPTKEPLFDYASSESDKPPAEEAKPSKFALQYVDGNFKDKKFKFEYDVVDRKKVKADDYGYSSSYTDNYIKQQNNLFTAINDSFFGAEAVKGETEPKFIAMVITDIKKGIETRSTFYLQDFKRYMSGDLPYDEYMKRFLADTKGGPALVGDEIGSHIEYKEVGMGEFLAKQIINRINFKFQRSSFPPSDDYDNDIIGIASDTMRYYEFGGFTAFQFSNLRTGKKYLFEPQQLDGFSDEPEEKSKSGGKLIHIRFDNGKAQFNDELTNTEINAE